MTIPNHLAFKAKITRIEFEKKLMNDFNKKGLFINFTKEEGQTLALYYVQGSKVPVHVATHSKGEGWIFKSAYE